MFLSDSHPRECAGAVQCVPQCFTQGSLWYRSTAKLFGGFKEPGWSPGSCLCCLRAGGRADTGRALGV